MRHRQKLPVVAIGSIENVADAALLGAQEDTVEIWPVTCLVSLQEAETNRAGRTSMTLSINTNSSKFLSELMNSCLKTSGNPTALSFAETLSTAQKSGADKTSAPASGETALNNAVQKSGNTARGGMPMAALDYFSFGDGEAMGLPKGVSRLEYNVYRPDGLDIDGRSYPFVVKSTGEKLSGSVADKYQKMLLDVTRQRIEIYKEGKANGLSDDQLLSSLQAFDISLPDSYRTLVGKSDMVAPSTRYNMPTHDEVMQA